MSRSFSNQCKPNKQPRASKISTTINQSSIALHASRLGLSSIRSSAFAKQFPKILPPLLAAGKSLIVPLLRNAGFSCSLQRRSFPTFGKLPKAYSV
jgi:hypothetical protein